MATFLDRVLQTNDYASDGGSLDAVYQVRPALEGIESGMLMPNTVAYFWNLTTPQKTQFDAIVATMPAQITILSTVLNVNARATWAARTSAPMVLGSPSGGYGQYYQNPTAVGSALGVAN